MQPTGTDGNDRKQARDRYCARKINNSKLISIVLKFYTFFENLFLHGFVHTTLKVLV